MKVKVNAGWQLGLEDSPKLYYEGDVFDAPDALAAEWISGGLAVAAKAVAKPKKAKAVKAAKNKAVTQSLNKGFVSTPTVVDATGPVKKTY